MVAYSLVESTIRLIQKHIKANILPALVDIRSDRDDPRVTTEAPPLESYFIFEKAAGYRPPAIFTIADNVDFRKGDGPNSTIIDVKVQVSVVVEDLTAENLTIKAYRYQDALYRVLDQTVLISNDEDVKVVVVVQRATFSPVFTVDTEKTSARNAFRKEVVLECDCRHFERPG